MGERTQVISLPDGRELTVRPATDADLDGMVALYRRLTLNDRRLRFFAATRPSRQTLERLVDASARGGLWVVCVNEEGEVVADAGYSMRNDGDAEFAVTVSEEWRGWLGSYLLDAMLRDAADHGVHNMRADIMLENRPMLRLAERRGYARVDSPDWSVASITMSTDGVRPEWPAPHERRRLLVESCGGRWHADAQAWAAGWDVITCAGPGSRSVPVCPLLEGRRCPLVEGADLVVMAGPPDDGTKALVEAHERAGSTTPVVVESAMSESELSRRLASRPVQT